jgi:tetratricopeptide (TPR) repeat protein
VQEPGNIYQNQNPDQIKQLSNFWDSFFRDHFEEAYKKAAIYESISTLSDDIERGIEYQAKVLLRQGLFKDAYQKLKGQKKYSPLKIFVEFLLTGDLSEALDNFHDDNDSLAYKTQSILLTKIYWGLEKFLDHPNYQDPDEIIEKIFDNLIDSKDFDRAILAAAQTLELVAQDYNLSQDLIAPIIEEQINNLIALSVKAKYNSTKAKIYLLKARLFGEKEAAEDAEILFGKDENLNGLAEVYTYYALDLNQPEYLDKALSIFTKVGNNIAQGFLYEAIASQSLYRGAVKEANEFFEKAEEKLVNCGIFEAHSLELQKLSLLAIQGNYSNIKKAIDRLLKEDVPLLFRGQAAQILSNTIIQIGGDLQEAKKLIEQASKIFESLKKYQQLLYAYNQYFQILVLESDLVALEALAQKTIQLADRLGNTDIKAAKYIDLAFATIRICLDQGELSQEKLDAAVKHFKKAIKLYQEENNLLGEADIYQSMGNMFANIGRLQEAFNAFHKAKDIYRKEKAKLQIAITESLIGILMLDYVVLNEQSYKVAQEHFESALNYFYSERLLDLAWKNAFYIAQLNEKYFEANNANLEYKNKAKNYYTEMLVSIEDFYKELGGSLQSSGSLIGIDIPEACRRAHNFLVSIGEKELAEKFKPFMSSGN